MSTRTHVRRTAACCSIALALAACGAGSDVAEQNQRTVTTNERAPSSEPTGAPQTTNGGTPTTEEPDTADLAQSPGAVDWMSADELVPFSDTPTPFDAPRAAATPRQHLEAMISDLFEHTTSDNRLVDAEMVDVVDWTTEAYLPDLVINTLSAAGSVRVESFDIVASYMDVGARAGYGSDATLWFQERAEPARALTERTLEAHGVVQRARALQLAGRRCFAGSDADHGNCDDQPTAIGLIEELAALGEPRIELPDDVSAYRDPVEACAAWDDAVSDQQPDAVMRLELSMSYTALDSKFIGRSECRIVETGEYSDLEADTAAGAAAFTAVYSALADVLSQNLYDPESPNSVPDDGRAAAAATLAHLRAGAATARAHIDELIEPNARLAMISIALRAEREIAWRQLVPNVGGTQLGPAPACFDSSSPEGDWLANCEGDQRVLAAFQLLYGPDSYVEFVEEVVSWRDIDRVAGNCDVWNAQLQTLDDDGALLVVQTYGLRELFGIDDC